MVHLDLAAFVLRRAIWFIIWILMVFRSVAWFCRVFVEICACSVPVFFVAKWDRNFLAIVGVILFFFFGV